MTLALALYWCLVCDGQTATLCAWQGFFRYAGADLPSFQTEGRGTR